MLKARPRPPHSRHSPDMEQPRRCWATLAACILPLPRALFSSSPKKLRPACRRACSASAVTARSALAVRMARLLCIPAVRCSRGTATAAAASG